MRVDADVLAWFKKKGRGYQTRINVALRKVMLQERKKSENQRHSRLLTPTLDIPPGTEGVKSVPQALKPNAF